MTKNSQYFIGTATLILLLSLFLPSRLSSYFLSFGYTQGLSYAPFVLLLFPIAVGLALAKRLTAAFIVSSILLLANTSIFENLLYVLFHKPELTFKIFLDRSLPFILYSLPFSILFYQLTKRINWIYYGACICILIVSYLWLNDSNCTIQFTSDMGMKTYDLGRWLENCGTDYAWWTAPIVLNIGLFNEMKAVADRN